MTDLQTETAALPSTSPEVKQYQRQKLILRLAAVGLTLAYISFLAFWAGPYVDAALRGTLMTFAVLSATLYCAGLAFVSEALARTSVALLSEEEERYRLLARNMSDVISRHSRSGRARGPQIKSKTLNAIQ